MKIRETSLHAKAVKNHYLFCSQLKFLTPLKVHIKIFRLLNS